MKFRCPYCRRECDFLEVTAEENLTAIILMMPAFGRDAHLVWAYAEVFGIVPLRAKARKLRVLMEEMKTLFQAEAFTFGRRRYRISQAGITAALNVVVHRHFEDRLDSHNYLKKIMIGIAEREGREAGRQAEKDLRQRETAAMSGNRDDQAQTLRDHGYEVSPEGFEPPTIKSIPLAHLTDEEIAANKCRLKEMVDKIGGGSR